MPRPSHSWAPITLKTSAPPLVLCPWDQAGLERVTFLQAKAGGGEDRNLYSLCAHPWLPVFLALAKTVSFHSGIGPGESLEGASPLTPPFRLMFLIESRFMSEANLLRKQTLPACKAWLPSQPPAPVGSASTSPPTAEESIEKKMASAEQVASSSCHYSLFNRRQQPFHSTYTVVSVINNPEMV